MDVELPKAAGGRAPNAPSATYEDITTFVTGPTSTATPLQPVITVPTPDGPKVLPRHEDVVTRMVPGSSPAEAIAYFVVVGPDGNDSNTRWQADPANSWPGAPLAQEIFVGTDWVKLNNHAVIEYGLAMGWLALRPFMYGGLITTRYVDPEVAVSIEVKIQPSAALPAMKEQP